ncbi:MAG: type III pantothenate kinase [Chitinophagaceae bacterium]|nr:type III pantothenate kinase [Chitinophagaceae bacterium]
MLPQTLCLDFGNTTYKYAIFQGDKLMQTHHIEIESALEKIKSIVEKEKIERAILVSVVNHDEGINEFLSTLKKFIQLNPKTNVPFINAYGTPETLGQDRVALLSGLVKKFPGEAGLVICIGTCITYNFLTDRKTFRGGAISPGINLRLKSMNQFTDKLPLVEQKGDSPLLGYDTETSLRSGVINGIAAEIDGIIDRYETQFGKINAVLTGGDAPFFESRLKSRIFADNNFIFKGLYAILEHNS